MLSKKIIIAIIGIIILNPIIAWAQYSSDIFDSLYEDLNFWEGAGYITDLPEFRPLPEVVLIPALKEVVDKGDEQASRKAKRYLKDFEFTTFNLLFTGFARNNSMNTYLHEEETDQTNGQYINGVVEFQAMSRLTPNKDLVWFSAGVGGHGIATKDSETFNEMRKTYFLKKSYNLLEELEEVKLGTAQGYDLEMALGSRTSFTVGKKDLFVQAGFTRRAIGPFYEDGILVSPKAPQSANLMVHWQGKKLSASWLLMSLSATQEYITFEYNEVTKQVTSEKSTRNKLNKYFSYNSLGWRPIKQFEINFFEAVDFGVFNLGYVIPLKVIYATDSLSDFAAGNLLAGVHMKIRPFDTFTIPIAFLIDDISVSQYIRFNFYSKLKAAGEIAAQWNPRGIALKELKLGYQIVTPYTYTHPPSDSYETYSIDYNDSNHSHFGQHLGTTLDPSSHRIYLNSDYNLFQNFTLGTIMKMEQHNNASHGILKGPLNDGSITDDGYRSVYDEDNGSESATFQKRFDFLNVGPIETRWEAGLNLGFEIPLTKQVNVFSDASYSFRYTNNYQLVSFQTRFEHIMQIEFGFAIKTRLFKKSKDGSERKYTEDSKPLKYE